MWQQLKEGVRKTEDKKELAVKLSALSAKREAVINAANILERWCDTMDLAGKVHKKALSYDVEIERLIAKLE